MTTESTKPDGDILGRDRFQSPGGLDRVTPDRVLLLDDRVEHLGTTVRDYLLRLRDGPELGDYPPPTRTRLVVAALFAARTLHNKKIDRERFPENKRLRHETEILEKKATDLFSRLNEWLDSSVTTSKGLACKRIGRDVDIYQKAEALYQLRESLRRDLDTLPQKTEQTHKPETMAALHVLACCYERITGERPRRMDRSDKDRATPGIFFTLAYSVFMIVGHPSPGNLPAEDTVDSQINEYLQRVRSRRG